MKDTDTAGSTTEEVAEPSEKARQDRTSDIPGKQDEGKGDTAESGRGGQVNNSERRGGKVATGGDQEEMGQGQR